VTPPSYRATKDLSIKEDIIEEIGRIYGFKNIKPEPLLTKITPISKIKSLELERSLKYLLSYSFNFSEVYTYSFNNVTNLVRLFLQEQNHIKLSNPLSLNETHLRISLIANLLLAACKNENNFDQIKIYEIGRVYLKTEKEIDGLPKQPKYLTCLYLDKKITKDNYKQNILYELKWNIEEILENFGIQEIIYKDKPQERFWHSGRCSKIYINNLCVGEIGEIHPLILKSFDLKNSVAICNINLELLFSSFTREKKYIEPSKFQCCTFDISVTVPIKTQAKEIITCIEKTNPLLINKVKLFDIYKGSQIPDNMKSLSFSIIMQSKEKTLIESELKELENKIIKAIEEKGCRLRSMAR
jgi:phenylalanyl-tRNA synthetase beta chain